MNDALMQTLSEVNSEVNVIPFNEVPGPREKPDFWTDAPVSGDSWVCRDISSMKGTKLRAYLPVTDLLEVLCYTEPVSENGEAPQRQYHAILSVHVDGEVWLLDNRVPYPYEAKKPLPYDYVGYGMQIAGSDNFAPYEFP